MAPKKKQSQPKTSAKPASKSKPQPSGAKPAPKLQISAENEHRLRRLLINTERPPSVPPPAAPSASETLSRSQRAKKLRNVYDKLSLEGFSPDQIERALSALNESATFETALDWLCLNIPGPELPLKFSSGAFSTPEDRSIKIISTAQENWVPIQRPVEEVKENMPGISIRIKGHDNELALELGGSSQADWIRQYMQQQEEVEEEEEYEKGEGENEDADPSSRAASIAKEYHHARLKALSAKQKGDNKSQDHFGDIIYKLKQEMSSLGLSDDILVSGFQDECTKLRPETSCDSTPCIPFEFTKPAEAVSWPEFAASESETLVNSNTDQASKSRDGLCVVGLSDTSVIDIVGEKSEALGGLELGDLFAEDSFSFEALPPDVLKLQTKEKFRQLGYGHALGNIDDIWKKGDPGRIPKAVLQKLCQRLGWEAPKYRRLSEKENRFLYAVSVLRTAIGRGKNRKAGGLITIQLPDQADALASTEDAQNKVAAYALSQLFPELPLHQMLTEPNSSFVNKWQEDEISTKLENSEDIHRAGFVDSLLDAETSKTMSSMDVRDVTPREKPDVPHDLCEIDSNLPVENSEAIPLSNAGRGNHGQFENTLLKKELENKMKLPKYRDMLEARATLPIAKLKKQLLQFLSENDVIVVCGETGCGKTTQVPQFILDDMIESGLGGQCSIICTQPRRIAAISVAERVSDERCESLPGSDGSLIGYQVRLDSARNEKTKLLFCTTGILLRKLAGNTELAGITHVIVDEVHERSLLGDFLLIVLKKLLIKQSSQRRQKLKVVLMSATVDSSLFSRYFGNCPVLTAEGRTHPVSTYFLEDIYEKLEYCLPSDSPASGMLAPTRSKLSGSSVDNHRGKKNLVLSAWGDESLLSEDFINPFYIPGSYESYSERTRENLKKLKEEIIDYDLLEDLIYYIDEIYPPGAILVFLTGVAEIELLVDRLAASYRFGGMSSDWVLPLHSSLASTDQRKVFLSPPERIRKVIVATDIAETSITIDDVVYVIDTGRHKENRYNPQKKMSSMVEDWISRANAKQRRGRAGRVKPGICFSLYTRHRFEVLMRPFQVPEMLRMPLTELCLQIKSLSLGDIRSFLVEAIEPPRDETISSAIDLLYKVGAFEGEEELSPLGYHLAKLPVDVLIGKMMVYGAVFGCLSPVLSIASFLSYKFPFVSPKDEKLNVERAKLSLLSDSLNNGVPSNQSYAQSDHLLVAVAYRKWARILREDGAKSANRFCRSFFLNSSVMYMTRDMRIQFGSLLADIGLVNLPKLMKTEKRKDKLDSWFADIAQPFNMHAHHTSIIKSIICAGLYPNVAATIEGTVGSALAGNKTLSSSLSVKDNPLWYDGRREVHIHPSSVNHNLKVFRYPFLVFLEKVETTKVFLRDTSIISPYSILLFGGPINVQHQTGLVIIDGWLKLAAPAQVAVLFKELRLTLHAVLKELIRKPEMAATASNEVVKSIIHLLLEEDKAQS